MVPTTSGAAAYTLCAGSSASASCVSVASLPGMSVIVPSSESASTLMPFASKSFATTV